MAKVVAGVGVGRGLVTFAVDLCSHSTWAEWLQQLHLGSNFSLAAHFFTTGSVSVQRRNVRHSGSAGLGATDPDGHAFSEIKS